MALLVSYSPALWEDAVVVSTLAPWRRVRLRLVDASRYTPNICSIFFVTPFLFFGGGGGGGAGPDPPPHSIHPWAATFQERQHGLTPSRESVIASRRGDPATATTADGNRNPNALGLVDQQLIPLHLENGGASPCHADASLCFAVWMLCVLLCLCHKLKLHWPPLQLDTTLAHPRNHPQQVN